MLRTKEKSLIRFAVQIAKRLRGLESNAFLGWNLNLRFGTGVDTLAFLGHEAVKRPEFVQADRSIAFYSLSNTIEDSVQDFLRLTDRQLMSHGNQFGNLSLGQWIHLGRFLTGIGKVSLVWRLALSFILTTVD